MPSLHDGKAAHIIAELHREGHSSLWQEIPAEQRERCTELVEVLRGLTDELEIQQKLHRANLNRMSAQMAKCWPELECEANLSSISILTLLSEYGTPADVLAHEEEAAALLKKVGGHFLKEDKRLAMLRQAQHKY